MINSLSLTMQRYIFFFITKLFFIIFVVRIKNFSTLFDSFDSIILNFNYYLFEDGLLTRLFVGNDDLPTR